MRNLDYHLPIITYIFFQHFSFVFDSLFIIKNDYSFFLKDKEFNVTKGVALPLLKPLNFPITTSLNT